MTNKIIIGEDTCSIVPEGLRGSDIGACRWFSHRYSEPDDANWFIPEGVPYPDHKWEYIETCTLTGYEGGWQPKQEIMKPQENYFDKVFGNLEIDPNLLYSDELLNAVLEALSREED